MKIDLSEKSVDIIYETLEAMQPKPADLLGQPVLSLGDMAEYQKYRDLIAIIKDQDYRWQRVN